MSSTNYEATPPPSGRGLAPVWQTLAIVVILLAGLVAGTVILRMKPAAPAAEEGHGDHEAEGRGAHEHGHGEKDEHDAAGRVETNAAKLKNANLTVEEAGPATIKTTVTLYGKAAANEEAIAHVSPRFTGIVKAVKKRLGDTVGKGDVLAVVESNDSLRAYDVKSEIAGTITAKDATLGELVNDQKTMFVVTDLRTVWMDLNVYRENFVHLKLGQKVLLRTDEADAPPIESEISYLSPFGAENTQSMLARAVVANPDGALRPGLFVNAQVITGQTEAPVAVRVAALQTMDQKPVVFVQEGKAFEARVVEVGRRDAEWVEIVAGVQAGDKYVAGNSFILKAEIGKEAAEHEH